MAMTGRLLLGMVLRVLLALLAACPGAFAAPPDGQPKRVALIVGNGGYPGRLALANPRNDARAFAEALGKVTPRFEIETAPDMKAAAHPVLDEGGNLMLLHRMADSLLGSIDIAIGKAFTSAAFKLATSELKDASTPAGELHGIQNSNDGRVVVFGGGLPVFIDGRIAGGIGVSGGTVDEDVCIVTHAISAVQEAR